MDNSNFFMEIKGINYNANRGLIVSGKISNGTVTLGDSLEIVSKSNILRTYVAAIQKVSNSKEHLDFSSTATSGDNILLLLTNSRNDNINIGYVLSTPQTVRPYLKCKAHLFLYNLRRDRKLLHSNYLECSINFGANSHTKCKLYLIAEDADDYVDNCFYILLYLDEPLIFTTGYKFDIYYNNSVLGKGIISEVFE